MEEFESPRPRYQNSQPQTYEETVQTTAYYQDNNGSYRKIPIKVTVKTSQWGGQSINVTAYYNYDYGQWQSLIAISASKCNGILGGEMESSFMYKAYLSVLLTTIYFDL